MKITREEAIELDILDYLLELHNYNYYNFMEFSDSDTEFELTLEQFKQLIKQIENE